MTKPVGDKAPTVIMYDSAEAAKKVQQVGWKSRLGHFYPGDNPSSEHGARWSGCTHMICECGQKIEKSRLRCDACQAKIDAEKYYALPVVEWDEVTPVSDGNKYWFDRDSLLDDMYWILEDAQKRGQEPVLHLVICEPHFLHPISADDWSDDLPDDGELPDAVLAAITAFNSVLAAQPTLCWEPGNERLNMDELWEKTREGAQ